MIGKVKKYTLATRGGENSPICLPVIYYEVDGKTHKVIGPEYKEYIIKSISSPTMGKLYPIGSEIEVHYSPENSKLSYAIRYCDKKSVFYITSITETLILIIDILMLIML